MRNGTKWAWLSGAILVSLVMLVPAPTRAQQPLADPDSKIRIGLNIVPAPFGSWKYTLPGGNVSFSNDTAFAFGFLPYVDYIFRPYFFLGFAPQFLFNVKDNSSDADAGRELDLLLRLGAQAPVTDRIQLYGYIAPGYSVLTPARGSDADGFVIGFHGGAWYDLTSRFFVNAQVGYQFGYQSPSAGKLSTQFFLFGLGAGTRL